ncbi:MAG: LacI family transcriptional regulator [Planctomycetota bacterium]
MPPSIADVAEKAHVSISTVSRVINRSAMVNSKTRERVESAIRELGYQPNAFARGLMLRRSEIVGLVLPDLHGDFYSEIIRGANQRAREIGYNLVVSSTRDSDEGDSILAAMQQRTLLDGVAVMVSELTDSIAEVLKTFRMPFVVLDDRVEGLAHDSVLIDQRHGAEVMMRHLLETCGMRRVIFVGGPETNFDTLARLAAYRATLAEAGIPAPESDIYHLDYQFDTAGMLAQRELKNWVGPRHGVFAANDEMAAGIIAAAQSMNIAIPDQLAVVGFDDTRIARMVRPALTTMRVPMARVGAEAVELLIQRILDPDREPVQVSLEPELIVRDSCGVSAGRE